MALCEWRLAILGVEPVTSSRAAARSQAEEEEVHELPVEGVFIYVAGSQPATEFLEGQVG